VYLQLKKLSMYFSAPPTFGRKMKRWVYLGFSSRKCKVFSDSFPNLGTLVWVPRGVSAPLFSSTSVDCGGGSSFCPHEEKHHYPATIAHTKGTVPKTWLFVLRTLAPTSQILLASLTYSHFGPCAEEILVNNFIVT
jgi:hypothetical protein